MKLSESREALKRLCKDLIAKEIPGVKLEIYSDPTVYAERIFVRVKAECYVIERVSPCGCVLETVSIGVNQKTLAVRIIKGMSGMLSL